MSEQETEQESEGSMSSVIGSVPPFQSESDDFEDWVEVFHQFLAGNKLDVTKAEDQCRGIFCSHLGLPTFTLLKDLVSPKKPSELKLSELITALKTHFKPAPKALSERYKFGKRVQQAGESVNQYVAELRKLATTCKFNCCLDERLRDQLILGLSSAPAQKVLFAKDDGIKLAEVVSIALAQETAQASTDLVRVSSPTRAATVHKTSGNRGKQAGRRAPQSSQSNKGQGRQQEGEAQSTCPNCGSNQHSTSRDCPHKDVVCHKCHRKGHFAKLCRSPKPVKSKPTHNKVSHSRVNVVKSVAPREYEIKLKVNNFSHVMEFDTGCQDSILSEDFWRNTLGAPALTKSKYVFRSYTNTTFRPLGELRVEIEYKGQVVSHNFPVFSGTSLFGRDLMKILKVDWSEIKSQCNKVKSNDSLESLLSEYSDVFSAPDGLIKNFKAKVVLKEDAVPRFLKARPVPFALREKVNQELDKMVSLGVFTKVETSEWASPIVVVPRSDGRIRITGDFKNTVNSQLHVTQYPLARAEDLFSNVSGGDKFSKLDGPDAFHQLALDESSKKCMVVNTHRGLYQYNVLPMGISSSPAIFQEFMDKLTTNIPMTGAFLDDCLCSGKDDDHHLGNLRRILQRMRESNYRLRKDKCIFMKPSVDFIGFVLSKEGIHTSPTKVNCIMAIQKPVNVSELSSFLGLVNFYRSFVPRFSAICEPLYRLTQKDTKWTWTQECQQAFDEIKRTLSSTEVLAHFDQSLPIGISCDASPVGLGVVLFHKYPDGTERPISYASKILSSAEKRYSQIDKEALGIYYGCKKYFQYLCGKKFILVTDHQPLVHIFSPTKQLPAYAASRINGWAVYLGQFQYEVVYRNTKQHGNADALSRHPVEKEDVTSEVESRVNLVATMNMENLPVTSKKIRLLSSRDKILSTVYRYVQNGWPTSVGKDDPIYPYYLRRDELSLVQGVIMWGIRVLVPTGLRQQLLTELHTGHFGIVRMKSLAREFIWWPNIDADIKALAQDCHTCRESSPSPPSAPLHPWEFPEKPWQRLHTDLAGPFLGKMWLIVMDAHSKWPEVFCLNNNATTSNIVSKIRDCIVRFGIPDQIVSDNGTQYTSQEFQDFCKSNGIRHTTSSVYHPRSNGEAERFVKTFKKSMHGAKSEWELTLQRFLFSYRLTPHATTGSAPCELLQGRKLKCLLDLVRPDPSSNTADSQLRQEESFNKRTRTREFQIGQRVWVKTFSKNNPTWSLGVIESRKGPLTFVVLVDDVPYRRHQDHILDAGSEISFRKNVEEGVEPDDVPIDFQSPVRQRRSTPRVVTPVPVMPLNVESEDDDVFEEAEAADDVPQLPGTPVPNQEPPKRTPYEHRVKRARVPTDRFKPGSK